MKNGVWITRWIGMATACLSFTLAAEPEMNELWGDEVLKLRAEDSQRGQLFNQGNYAMFIHWGLYSQVANRYQNETYYGIGEWLMHKRMADIPVEDYKKLAATFHPVKFDAAAIARLAREAGMKYVVITSKHHDGFAMYDSDACDFNIVDATPWQTDPMKELAAACRKEGLGFGFYYSHNQDWTFPGGGGGPKMDADGKPAGFDDYFHRKCLPQVEEITSRYGPIELVWFDTPGRMPKKYVEQLVGVVRRNQPNALVSGRAGHGLGDYRSLGDMEVPVQNLEGMWESVDTTNDSWGYAWYDENWKTPREILSRVVACVARGGTYMLNIGPRGDGSVPDRAARSLRASGKWIQRHPQVVYGAEPSPWGHALPWGDITRHGKRLYLTVFDWPSSGKLHLSGLKTPVAAARLMHDEKPLSWSISNGWTLIDLPSRAPDPLATVIELELAGEPEVIPGHGLDPSMPTRIRAEFANVEKAKLSKKHWMEKFGEWKACSHVHQWQSGGKAVFQVNVLEPGDYQVALTYSGEGRLVWSVAVAGGERIQNQLGAAGVYHEYDVGWLHFPAPGDYQIEVSCLDGDLDTASLQAIHFVPVVE